MSSAWSARLFILTDVSTVAEFTSFSLGVKPFIRSHQIVSKNEISTWSARLVVITDGSDAVYATTIKILACSAWSARFFVFTDCSVAVYAIISRAVKIFVCSAWSARLHVITATEGSDAV